MSESSENNGEPLEKSPSLYAEESDSSSVIDGKNNFVDDMAEKSTSKDDKKLSSFRIGLQETPKQSVTPKAKPIKELLAKKATNKSPRGEIKLPSKKAPIAKKSENATKKEPTHSTAFPIRDKKKVSKESVSLQEIRSVTSIASRVSTMSRSSRKSFKKRSMSLKQQLPKESFKIVKMKAKKSEPLREVKSQWKESHESHYDDLATSESESFDISVKSLLETEVAGEPMEISQRLAFLQILKQVPDIQDLSETTTIESLQIQTQETEETSAIPLDTGHFVDAVSSSQHSDSENSPPSPEYETAQHPADKTDSDSDISDLVLDFLSESEVDFSEPRSTEETAEDVSKSMMSIAFKSEELSEVEIGDDDLYKAHLATMEACEQLLTQLIDKAVNYAESDDVRLTRILDKEKMMKQLHKLTVDYMAELHRNARLDSLICDYYLRKNCLGLITESKRSDTFSKTRYGNAILELDTRLSMQIQAEKMKEKTIKNLQDEVQAATIEAEEKVRHFENKVSQTLCFRDGFDHLKSLVGDILRGITTFRGEVDQVRLNLLLTQHQYAALKIQLDEMENLGDGFKMHEYLSHQATNQSLGIKLEDRNAELKRLSGRITHDIHALAHYQNKDLMCSNILSRMKTGLQRRVARRESLRMIIYKAKVKHLNLKNEKKNIRAAGCLMHFPDLMRDYDVTVEQLEGKRVVVKKLRSEHERLERRAHQLGVSIAAEAEQRLRSIRSVPSLVVKK
ncbi:uncharacterized protein LOC117584109 [Drosophila guanche]|uniref:CCDC113/CCDC96 coiled-coil domain-containing protein n=1 Tax=Drosophila guanche TaxID=7266 RepID=A0A3B0K910_DROGU|nr:uncharacterized protein LOC117584109 [Drosophila guanche]SPP82116.1 Hypothetical predicted protein [Drosophila guanche]